MKVYDVTVTEILENVVSIEAESRDEAEQIAWEQWDEKTIDLKSRRLKELEIMASKMELHSFGLDTYFKVIRQSLLSLQKTRGTVREPQPITYFHEENENILSVAEEHKYGEPPES